MYICIDTVINAEAKTRKKKRMFNGTMMQYFHWYYPGNGSLWRKIQHEARKLSALGITALWLPPAFKAASGKHSVGYDIYDLYDLGEFNQKETVRTKYGTKDEYLRAIRIAQEFNIQVYADIVFNHKGGADETENVLAKRILWQDRNVEYGDEVRIDAWTKFTFPGRKKKYSDFTWCWHHFDGVDWAENLQEKTIFKIMGENRSWDPEVDRKYGNYDYLMYADIDFQHPEVRRELMRWGEWFVETTNINGFRLDAIKHIEFGFFEEWLNYLRAKTGKELFSVGEYWHPSDVGALLHFIERTKGTMSLFDVPLHKNLHIASKQGSSYDLRRIFDGSLIKHRPDLSVTIVENHDTQPLQALESPVDFWFRPLAYALILLRKEGYPCIFYPDIYGTKYRDKGKDGNNYNIVLSPVPGLPEMLKVRKLYAYGEQRDYFNHQNIIGWTREGDFEHNNSGIAVTLSNGGEGSCRMEVGKRHRRKQFVDCLKNRKETVELDNSGWGDFPVNQGSVSVWIEKYNKF